MLNRPKSFEEFKGSGVIVNLIRTSIAKGTLPHFILLEGEEGIGKTTLANLIALSLNCESANKPCGKCASCRNIIENVIEKNKSTSNVLKYKMSVEGGKEAAKEVLEAMQSKFIQGNKVLILDEAHGMSDAAQDVFLTDTEYLHNDNAYIIMCTTDTLHLKKTLKSRAVSYKLSRPSTKEIISLLKTELARRNLRVQREDTTLNLIATWSECKPRKALNFLEAFGTDNNIEMDAVKELIGFTSVDDIIPILKYLGGSMALGIAYISEMSFSNSFIDITVEALKLKLNQPSYKLTLEEQRRLKEALVYVSEEALVTFTYHLCDRGTNSYEVIAAFLKAHPSHKRISAPSNEVMQMEAEYKATLPPAPIEVADDHDIKKLRATSLKELLAGGNVCE